MAVFGRIGRLAIQHLTALLCFLTPILLIGLYMHREYEFNFSHFQSHWFTGRVLSIITFLVYSAYVLFAGYVGEFLNDAVVYLILPSFAFASIIFAKHNRWHFTGDIMFFCGCVYFFGFVLWLVVEELVIYV